MGDSAFGKRGKHTSTLMALRAILSVLLTEETEKVIIGAHEATCLSASMLQRRRDDSPLPLGRGQGPAERGDVCGTSARKYDPLAVFSWVLFWPNTLHLFRSPAPGNHCRAGRASGEGSVGASWGLGEGTRAGAARASHASTRHESPPGTRRRAGH